MPVNPFSIPTRPITNPFTAVTPPNSKGLFGSTMGTQTVSPQSNVTPPANTTKTPYTPPVSKNNAKSGAVNTGGSNTPVVAPPVVSPVVPPVKPTVASTLNQPIYDPQTGALTDYGKSTGAKDLMATGDTSYKGLLSQSAGAANVAGDLARKVALAESAAEHNPNYSNDTGLGVSGQIARNYGAAITGANTTAGLLGNLANTNAPVQVPYGTQYGSPSDLAAANAGETPGGGALNPLNNVNSIAQQVINGTLSPSQAYAMGGSVNNWQGLLNSEIQKQKPGFDTAKAEGSYSAKQTNTTTSGTAPVNAAASVYGNTYNDLLNIKNTTSNVDQFGNLLIKNMGGINPGDVKYANQTIAQIRGQLSSDQQAQFDTTFAQLRAQIASLLQTGGAQIPTQITADANKIIDGSAPIGTLTATLQRIKTEGDILTGNIQTKLNTAGSVIGAAPSGNNSNPAGI